MKKYLPVIFLFLLGACTRQYAFGQEYRFTSYNASDGLPSSEIISLAKDDKGFLWVGTTAGISLYDGYVFSNYQYSADDHFLGTVNVIKPAGKQGVWIGASSGLYCFTQNRLVKISAETGAPQGVNDILAEPNGDIWLATENGPAFISRERLDPVGGKTLVLEDFVLPQWTFKNASLDQRRTVYIKRAADSTLFTAQYHTIYRVEKNTIDVVFTLPNKRDMILSIFPVSRDKLFFDCAKSEMNKIERGQRQAVGFKKHNRPGSQPGTESFWYTGTSGIFCFDPVQQSFSTFINTIDSGFLWTSCLLKDENFFWLGTHDGLIKVKPSVFKQFAEKKYDPVKEAYSFIHLKSNHFLIGTNRGKVWKKQGTDFTNYFSPGRTFVSLAEVKSLYEDERGWLWAGTGYQGIAVYRDGKIDHFNKDDNGLHDNTIEFFFKTRAGKFFALGDHGLSEILVDEKDRVSFRSYYYLPNASRHAKFFAAVEAPDGTVWAGGEEGIRFLKNDSLYPFQLLDKPVSVKCMKMAADSSVWIATAGKGIFHCRFQNNRLAIVKQFTENDGLNSLLFIDLLADKEDNIWAASAKGLSFIGRHGKYKGRVLNFNESDGFLRSGYSSIRLYQDREGAIWAGTTIGITSLRPEELFLSNIQPKAYITGVRSLQTNSQLPLTDAAFLEGAETASPFPHNHNAFSFTYTAIDFANQRSVLYYYRLNGIDSAWTNGNYNRSVTYQNLLPGKYSFRVKAVNDKGLWSKEEAVYHFVIAPPFWKTWWFRMLALLVAGAIVFAFIRRRERVATRREAEKTAIEKLKAISYQYQLEIEQVINYFSTSIHQQSSIDDVLWDVTRNCISKLGFEDCVIYLVDTERRVLVQKAAWGPKTTPENKILHPIEIPVGKGIVGHVAFDGRALIIPDTSVDERYIVDDERRLSEITVPIVSDQTVMGVIDSEHSQRNFYTERHLHILTTIASLLADKIVKMNAEQQTREKEIEVLRLNKDLATWQITALRAQMNPHFIFNAMNSIQQFTLQNDTDNANLYISKFSTLLRKVLHTSQQTSITLDEEMEQLQLYLEIEKLRMGENFFYNITADEEVETDALKIPGMLVQPFVENAVKHGLALKEGEKRIGIHFSMPDEKHLHAVVTDNGIGRQRAAAIKQQQTLLPHVSKGIQLVKERLQLLEQNKDHHSAVNIEDLPQHTGTKVTLIIPLPHAFILLLLFVNFML